MPHRADTKHTRPAAGSTSSLTDRLIKGFTRDVVAQLTWSDFGWGLGIAVLFSILLTSFSYQSLPLLHLGEPAPVEIRASHDLTVEDPTATLGKRSEVMRKVPAIFDYDPSVLTSLDQTIQRFFTTGRNALTEFQALDHAGAEEAQVITTLKNTFGDSIPDEVLAIGYKYRFAKPLEDAMLALLHSVMTPGVINNKEAIQQQQSQQSEIRIVNIVAGHDEPLKEIRDVLQARHLLRQGQGKLASVDAAARAELIRYLEILVTPNVVFNKTETAKARLEAAKVSPVIRYIPQGKVIVHKGDLVTDDVLVEVDALKRFQDPPELLQRFIGYILINLIFMYIIWHYFIYHQKRHRKIRNHYVLLMLVLFLNLVTTWLTIFVADLVHDRLGLNLLQDATAIYYAIPLGVGAILVTLLVDVQIAMLYSLFFAVLIGMLTSSVKLASYVLVGSFAAIYGIKQYKERSAIVKAGFAMGLVNIIALLSLDMFTGVPPVFHAWLIKALCGLASGVMSAMVASLLLPGLESLFKITTDIKLLELSNLNTPILRRMAVEAPGTYHHSIAVGTLAEAAAEAIGANPLLVRVASYYHDIGKMAKAEYYIENQLFSQNKHDKLTPHMSSLIIANHVNAGLAMAKELRLMPRVSDMIPQHHGTRLMTYFYEKAKASARKDEEVNAADFRYPGPKPQSREAAIMMIADCVEAASRTLTGPTPAQIQGMIHRIIDVIVSDGQFSECDITLKDLNLIEQAMLRVLSGVYHHRIEYPGYDFSKLERESQTAKQGAQ